MSFCSTPSSSLVFFLTICMIVYYVLYLELHGVWGEVMKVLCCIFFHNVSTLAHEINWLFCIWSASSFFLWVRRIFFMDCICLHAPSYYILNTMYSGAQVISQFIQIRHTNELIRVCTSLSSLQCILVNHWLKDKAATANAKSLVGEQKQRKELKWTVEMSATLSVE